METSLGRAQEGVPLTASEVIVTASGIAAMPVLARFFFRAPPRSRRSRPPVQQEVLVRIVVSDAVPHCTE